MEIELLLVVSLLPETFNVLIAPVEVLTRAQSSHLDLQRYKILNICGPQLRPAGSQHHRAGDPPANTFFQLKTILEENHHSFLIVEHDPMLYEDAGHMVECIAQVLKQTSRSRLR